MSIFKGAGVAIVTPMKSDLEVNYDKLAELLEEQIAGKSRCDHHLRNDRRICNNVRRGTQQSDPFCH